MIAEKILIIEYSELPKITRQIISDKFEHKFMIDTYIEYQSEMSPMKGEFWSDILKEEYFHEYYEDQVETNGYKESFNEFLTEYGLSFDWWIKDQNVDLNVSKILIKFV